MIPPPKGDKFFEIRYLQIAKHLLEIACNACNISYLLVHEDSKKCIHHIDDPHTVRILTNNFVTWVCLKIG